MFIGCYPRCAVDPIGHSDDSRSCDFLLVSTRRWLGHGMVSLTQVSPGWTMGLASPSPRFSGDSLLHSKLYLPSCSSCSSCKSLVFPNPLDGSSSTSSTKRLAISSRPLPISPMTMRMLIEPYSISAMAWKRSKKMALQHQGTSLLGRGPELAETAHCHLHPACTAVLGQQHDQLLCARNLPR